MLNKQCPCLLHKHKKALIIFFTILMCVEVHSPSLYNYAFLWTKNEYALWTMWLLKNLMSISSQNCSLKIKAADWLKSQSQHKVPCICPKMFPLSLQHIFILVCVFWDITLKCHSGSYTHTWHSAILLFLWSNYITFCKCQLQCHTANKKPKYLLTAFLHGMWYGIWHHS